MAKHLGTKVYNDDACMYVCIIHCNKSNILQVLYTRC